jgi:hypothetical protein
MQMSKAEKHLLKMMKRTSSDGRGGREYLFNRTNSQKLAAQIERYWHSRGFPAVKAVVEEGRVAMNQWSEPVCIFTIRSNISDVVRFDSSQALAA